MPDRIPLSAEDRAILSLESGPIAGHTCKVVVCDGALDPAALRDSLRSRLADAPELTYVLDEAGEPAWRPDPDPDLEALVVERQAGRALPARELPGLVGELFAERLDRARPLWRMDLARLASGGSAIVWRIHHALADGTTAVRLARAALFDPRPGAAGHAATRPGHGASGDHERRRFHLARTLERELSRSRDRSPFDARVGARREVRFAQAPLGALHDAAKAVGGATVNDAVLACVAGGLRRWLGLHGRKAAEVRAKVPVSLHDEGDAAGNRDSFFTVPLPLAEPDPRARLAQIHAATAERKRELDAEELARLHRELGRASRRAEALAERLESSPRRFALNVSNVPGPREPATVLGSGVSWLGTIAEVGQRHALRIAVLSYAGHLRFGLCADADAVDELDALAAGIEAEAELLTG